MLRVMMECTSLMSSLSLDMLRCVRVSRYSFFVFEMNVSASKKGTHQSPAWQALQTGVMVHHGRKNKCRLGA